MRLIFFNISFHMSFSSGVKALKFYTSRQIFDLLDHVEDGFVLVEPDVVVGHGHLLEGDLFGVFEERVGPPHELKPTDR
jgi:hypothetical protein